MTSTLRRFLLVVSFVVLTVTLASCNYLRRETTYGDNSTFVIGQTVYLACTETCRVQQQCGDLVADGNPAVLLNQNSVSTRAHNLVQPQNLPVEVLEVSAQDMVTLANTEQRSQLNFYFVNVQQETGTVSGWVAGWCVADQSVQ